MARNTGDQQRDQSPRRSAAGTNSNRTSTANASSASNTAGAGTRSDQERSIQTNREQPQSRAQAPRSQAAGTAARRDANPYGMTVGSAAPFTAMRRMAEDMERLFDALGFGRSLGFGQSLAPLDSAVDQDVWREPSALSQATWAPQVEMFRRGDQLVVRADLPGVKKDDVQVEVENGMLSITGERKESHEEHRNDFYRTERSYGRFFRSFALPEGVSGDHCEATFSDGVLEITLPAPNQQEQSRRIHIR